jgi:hypothetical protein
MAQSDTKIAEKIEVLWHYCAGFAQSTSLLNKIGYGFLLLSLLDLITLLTPPHFMNPVWEFQTFGAIVERAAVLLLGFALVFFGEGDVRSKLELPLLRVLSWLVLIVAVLFFLMIPLGVFNSFRIDRQNKQQITAQIERGTTQVQDIQKQLAGITTQEQMEAFLNNLSRTGRSPEIGDTQQLEKVKEELASSLAQGEKNISTQAKEMQASQRLELLKTSVKWNLGALISGVFLLVIWQGSRWTRR